jgi:hypothetical protein
MKRNIVIIALVLSSAKVFGGSVTVSDFDITAFQPGGGAYTTGLSALWGTYASGVFTPLIVTTPTVGINTGYLVNNDNEFLLNLTQGNNDNIAIGAPLFASIFTGASYSSSAAQIVLSDPSWIAPTFTITTPELAWTLTASTIAMPLAAFGNSTGTYSYNSGSPEITTVPEPSTYALLAMSGLALGGYVIRRRRRA